MTRLLLGGFLVTLLCLPILADAAEEPAQTLAQADKDGDGKLSLSEFQPGSGNPKRAERRFGRADKDGDGLLDEREFKRAQAAIARQDDAANKGAAKKPKPAFLKADENADGRLDLVEFKTLVKQPMRAEARFKKADKDGDNFVTPAEFASAVRPRPTPEPAPPQPTQTEPAPTDPVPAAPGEPTAVEGARSSDRDPLQLTATIDREIGKKLAEAKIPESPPASDAEFVRRLSLDLRGRIPSLDETEQFLNDQSPDKRRTLIDQYLADPEFGEHLAIIWYRRMVKPDTDNRALISTNFRDWLADRFNKNQGWDRLVTDILTASGDRDQNPAVVFWLANIDGDAKTQIAPNEVATAASRLFLGVKLECCECHNHPFDPELKQSDFWSTAAFFTATHTRDANRKLIKTTGVVPQIYEDHSPIKYAKKMKKETAPAGSIVIPDTGGKIAAAGFLLEGSAPQSAAPLRSTYAAWLTAPQNPYFAKAAANRLWAHCFGRGVVEPADDLRSAVGATHPELLEALSAEFLASQFDLKHLLRAICNSQAYGRTSEPLAENKEDESLYSHMPLRMMTADVLFDSLTVALDHEPASGSPRKGKGKRKNAERRMRPREEFLAYFHAEADDDSSAMEAYTHGIPQVLRLMNSDELNDTDAVASELVRSSRDSEQTIASIYLRVLSRRPTESETARMQQYLAASMDPATGAGELMWTLLNCSEFLFNH